LPGQFQSFFGGAHVKIMKIVVGKMAVVWFIKRGGFGGQQCLALPFLFSRIRFTLLFWAKILHIKDAIDRPFDAITFCAAERPRDQSA